MEVRTDDKLYERSEATIELPFSRKNLAWFPPELKQMIFKEIPDLYKIALGLVSKPLMHSLQSAYNGRFPTLGADDRTKLLLLLEKDNPHLFICFGCRKLWPLNASSTRGHMGQSHKVCPGGAKREVRLSYGRFRRISSRRSLSLPLDRWTPEEGGPEIDFTEAHLVMMRYKYGPGYSLPIRALQHSFRFQRIIDPGDIMASGNHFPLDLHVAGPRSRLLRSNSPTIWNFSHTYSARVIDNELYVTRRHEITGPDIPGAKVAELLDTIHLPVCHHIYGGASLSRSRRGSIGYGLIPELKTLTKNPRFLEKFRKQGKGSCKWCFTDYDITLWCGDGRWNMELNTYHRLGACHNLDDTWLSFNNFHSTYIPDWHSDYFQDHPNGRDPTSGRFRQTCIPGSRGWRKRDGERPAVYDPIFNAFGSGYVRDRWLSENYERDTMKCLRYQWIKEVWGLLPESRISLPADLRNDPLSLASLE